jgi:hypothetical protein
MEALGKSGIPDFPKAKGSGLVIVLCSHDRTEIQLYGQGARKGPLSFSCQ